MPYNSVVVNKVLTEFESKNRLAHAAADKRREELYLSVPELESVDKKLSETYIKIINKILHKDNDPNVGIKEFLETLRGENKRLQDERNRILTENNIPIDYTDPKFDCPQCTDTGYIGEKMCECLKMALARESFKYSGLGENTKRQRFDNFNVNFYPEKSDTGLNIRRQMKNILEFCKGFAARYGDEYPEKNIFFCGGTGLGKTHLSSAIAQVLIERGFDVVYDSAMTILYSFERERFPNLHQQDSKPIGTARYFDCDFLIIDDLGTEFSGNMSVSALYNIINSRIVAGRGTLINTNLTPELMQKKYDDRIVSRILGEFKVIPLSGEDIRLNKIEQQRQQNIKR